MELKEYIAILRKQKRWFWGIALGLIAAGLIWQQTQPKIYSGDLLLNVGRSGGTTTTGEYTYDNFYRLQADERFADTLVRWLSNSRFVLDTLDAAGLSGDKYTEKDLTHIFSAERLSSQVVEVRFTNQDTALIKKIAQSVLDVSDRYTSALNPGQDNWFVIVGSDPVIRDARVPLWPFAGMLVAGAVLVAFFGVLFREYWERQSGSD